MEHVDQEGLTYQRANVLLAGDSGVGKTGLARALTSKPRHDLLDIYLSYPLD